MSLLSKEYAIYFDSTVKLAKSIILKIDAQNDVLNGYLSAVGEEVSEDPRTWKYNLNLCGIYHPLDTVIQLVSFDDKTTIDFTNSNLESHPRTHVRLMNGESDYYTLRNKYPKLVLLINGILDPLDLDDVVNARNWKILRYDQDLVQSNELSLMYRIQEWIDAYVARWFNQAFQLSDRLYVAAFLDGLYSLLPSVIINIRLELSKTKEASEYHIWHYLASKYGFDKYKPYLATEQAVWLFRNIDSLKANVGKGETLEKLLVNIALPNNVDLYRLNFIQTDDDLITYRKLVPRYTYTDYFEKEISFDSGDVYTSDDIVNSLKGETEFNAYTIETDKAEALAAGVGSLYNLLPTKVLKAEEGSNSVTKTEFVLPSLVNHWGYLSHLGLYSGVYTITLPGNEVLYLDAKESFLLWLYAGMRSLILEDDWEAESANDDPAYLADTPENEAYRASVRGKLRTLLADGTVNPFPKVVFNSVSPVTIDVNKLMSVVPNGTLTKAQVNKVVDSRVALRTVTEPSDLLNFVQTVVNQDAIDAYQLTHFKDNLEEVARVSNTDGEVYDSNESYDGARAAMLNVIEGCFKDVQVDLLPNIPMNQWLFNLGVEYDRYTATEWHDLSLSIPEVLLNQKVVTDSLGDVKTAILDLLQSLTSYDLVFTVGTRDAENYREIDWPSLDVSVVMSTIETDIKLDYGLGFIADSLSTHTFVQEDLLEIGLDIIEYDSSLDLGVLDYGLSLLFDTSDEYDVYVPVGGLNIIENIKD